MEYIADKSFHFSDNLEINFYYIYKKLQSLGCSYLSYILIKDNGEKIRFTTNQTWQDHFLGNNLISYCPLTYLTEIKQQKMIIWNKLNGLSREQKDVMLERECKYIFNGITLSQKINNNYEVVVLATDDKKYDFSFHAIKNNFLDLKRYFLIMREIAGNANLYSSVYAKLSEQHF